MSYESVIKCEVLECTGAREGVRGARSCKQYGSRSCNKGEILTRDKVSIGRQCATGASKRERSSGERCGTRDSQILAHRHCSRVRRIHLYRGNAAPERFIDHRILYTRGVAPDNILRIRHGIGAPVCCCTKVCICSSAIPHHSLCAKVPVTVIAAIRASRETLQRYSIVCIA